MKTILSLTAFLFLAAGAIHALELSSEQERQVVSYYESMCGDQWCESSELENLHFVGVKCAGSRCSFKMELNRKHFACTVTGVNSLDDLYNSKTNEQINKCIAR